MRKVLVGFGVLALSGLFLVGVGCEEEEEAGELNLQYEVVDDGGSLELTWDEIEGADQYYIYVDGELIDSTTNTTYTVTEDNAGAEIKVEAVGADKSETLDIAGEVVQSSVNDWGEYNSAYKSAVGFTDGSAVTYSILDSSNFSSFEIILDDGDYGGVDASEIDFCSPNVYSPSYNEHDNGFADWSGGIVAPEPGNYYTIYPGSGGIVQGNSYAAWLDPAADGWTTTDHFVRIDITGVGGDGNVTATFYYQTIGGLRWIPVD